MPDKQVVGVLALQGAVEPHLKHLKNLGVEAREVRLPQDLQGIQGLILPGGESTTMIKLADQFGMWDELKALSEKIPFWGICAGSILMAKHVTHPEQKSLGVMDIEVARNAYGRQVDSFASQELIPADTRVPPKMEAVFIRAPQFTGLGKGVRTLATLQGKPVFLEEGRHMVTAFHPELTDNPWFHQYFLKKISS